MKNILFIVFMLPIMAIAQNTNQNFVKTTVFKEAVSYPVYTGQPASTQEQVTYLDGLGRPIQQVTGKASASQKDVITPITYDEYGRQVKEYLPYEAAGSNLEYNSNALNDVINFYNTPYYENTTNPYAEKFFEPSPAGRVYKQGAPGTPWKGNTDNDNDHTVKFGYQLNTVSDAVKMFVTTHPHKSVTIGQNIAYTENTELTELTYNGYYQYGQLYKNIVKDENWTPADGVNKTTEEFKNPLGRIILKRNYNAGQKHDTYYVYDRFSNLSYVIPPLASDNITYAGTSVPVFNGRAYPWVAIVSVDRQLADDYNRALMDYENAEILNVDLIDKYGGQGGFAITQDETGNLSISYNVTTTQPMVLRLGEIMSLNEYGHFEDKELGRIKGSGYEYYFLIKNNALYIDGHGKVPSLTAGFTGGNPLTYTKNYAWTTLYDGDPQIAKDYEAATAGLDNSDILTTYTANPYNATGGISVSLDEQDNLTLSVNMTSNTGMALKTGVLIPFDFKRRITDRDMGTLTIDGAAYTFTVKDNALEVRGAGVVGNVSYTNIIGVTKNMLVRQEAIEGLCYIYHYDSRNRLIEKKIPGKQWEYIIYDKRDRVVLTGPAFNPFYGDNEGWMHTLYDDTDRPTITGWFPAATAFNPDARLAMQANATFADVQTAIRNNSSSDAISYIATGYNLPAAPFTLPANYQLLTVNYYDTYGFPGFVAFPSNAGVQESVQGQATGSYARVLSGAGSTMGVISVTGYDAKARPVYTRSINQFFTSETTVASTLDFSGKLLSTVTTKKSLNLPDLTVYDNYTYDHAERLLRHRQSQISPYILGNVQHIIADNTYDALGRLVRKGIGAKTGTLQPLYLQTPDYSYNIRGWLKGVNNVENLVKATPDLFAFALNYNTSYDASSPVLYNGNIAETLWRSRTDDQLRMYSYRYDNLNRLTDGFYMNKDATTQNGHYDEKDISYDKNGNIQSLNRVGLKQQSPTAQYDIIDALGYIYPQYSNRLERVKDTGGTVGYKDGGYNAASDADFRYDLSGNMTHDFAKNLGTPTTRGITYNHLNLPITVPVARGTTSNIEYVYDATGIKLQKMVNYHIPNKIFTGTRYDNGFVYEYSQLTPAGNPPVLQFYAHPEGYVKVGPVTANSNNVQQYTNFEYVYQYKDHLGNVRLSYSDSDGNGIISNTEDFRDDFNTQKGWTDTNTPPVFSYEPVNGNYAGKIVNNTTTEKYLHSDYVMNINNTGNVTYNYSVRVKGEPGSGGAYPVAEVVLFMKTEGETGYFTQVSNKLVTTNNTWITLSNTVSVPANIKKLSIRIDNNGGGTIWYDDVVIRRNTAPASEIVEESNYYPFGMKQEGYNNIVQTTRNIPAQRYKYNSKEYQDELGFNVYDYGARFYDPALGKWFSVDQMAEKYYENSPYNYALNNPVIYIDPDGNQVEMCCDGLKAFLLTATDNVVGTNFRNRYDTGTKAYRNGKSLAHGTSIAVGAILEVDGAASMIGGGMGLTGSAVTAGTGIGAPVGAAGAVISTGLIAKGALETALGANIIGNTLQNMKDDMASNTSNSNNSNSDNTNHQTNKTQKSKTIETIGGKYSKTTEIRPSKQQPGQSRAEYVRYKNSDGKVIKTHKDTYDRANKFQHRKPLRGGPEGRPQ